MNERRESFRHLVYLNVDLYHDAFGHVDGKIQDVSSGGMSISLSEASSHSTKFRHKIFHVKPANMDVLFNMKCLRVSDDYISLEFLE